MNDSDFITPDVSPVQDAAGDQTVVLASSVLPERIHVLPIESKPVFPGLMFPVMYGPGPEADTLRKVAADVQERIVGLVLQKQEGEYDDAAETVKRQLYPIGTAARILKIQESDEGAVQALLQGQKRFQILEAAERDQTLMAQVIYLEDVVIESDDVKALGLAIMNTMRDLIKHNPLFSEEIKMFLTRADWGDPGRLADFSVTMTSATGLELQEVLESLDVKSRMEKALFILRKELDINELKERITHQIEEKISKQQREFFLREQLKAIKQELGLEKDEKTEEIRKYETRLEELELGEEARTRIEEEITKLKLLPEQSPEFAVSRNYLDWLTGLPWGIHSDDQLDVRRSRRVLDRDHYGLDDVKKRILEFIGVAKLRGSIEGSILCLIGPPGVGKTSLGKGVAEALGRKFYRFSLGGMRDEAEIKGHRRTYIGALPGKVMQAIKTVGTANPVIMLDEIDKVGVSFQGDPASALLEVLDPEQNSAFRDHYLDVPFDLSKILFIATANVPDTIPGPLMDRMEIIRLSGYITDEKLSIAKRHLVPRLLPRNGLPEKSIRFSDAALRGLITGYAREAGVRALEKAIGSCLRKIATRQAEEDNGQPQGEKLVVTPEQVAELLGKPTFVDDPLMKRRKAGVVMGLAWTSLGGATLYIEAIRIPGERGIKLTGQLGEVMVESSHIAYSLVSANAKRFGIDASLFEKGTIHLHVPAGATKKDGPSAGITMATALISLALNRKPPARLAMTGELTLTGRVLPVGGIKEKVIAAKRSKVKRVILPAANEKDFEEIPERVKRGITARFVEDFQDVFKLVFEEM
ncbi:MAG: endopeptidase La [Lentisphaerae bacterium]|jgi:ATP-dependent Lon protease|nr:endopeptidase La [Lentisphaerota bacterium]MBT4815911.1 endopeptidase La [Lentisphaerota bacterium]MBT5611614.1 endopeptidase La [Lentisphaerota bacterium]MBT7061713.1 endopeptidase La [Lentisphaerota bacterium]MBT7846559.1 endopeptidase La [Lentisphaerota bacterium]